MIDPNRIDAILKDCLFTEEEMVDGKPPEGYIEVDAVVNRFGFHPERIESHREEVEAMLAQLPSEFQRSGGGGMSLLNGCVDKDGNQWTGFQQNVGHLFALGMALGKVGFVLPREMWSTLPGGVPYYVINDQ